MSKKQNVSVCMITYNHGAFIAQAIESVFMQKCDFDLELVIGEDCSTDNTRAVIEDYQTKYPGKIRLITTAYNVGMQPNFIRTFQASTGQYVAMLEGDDFWTDSNKLQKQIDFLEANPDYVICAHNVNIVRADGRQLGEVTSPVKKEATYDIYDLASSNMLTTCSCVYRNVFTSGANAEGFPEWMSNIKMGDYCLHLLAAKHGKIKYFPKAMGAYRLHGGGAWTGSSHFNKWMMVFESLHHVRSEFSGKVDQQLMQQQLISLRYLAALEADKFRQFLHNFHPQISELLAHNYPFALASLLSECGIVETPEPSVLARIRNRIMRYGKLIGLISF